MKNIFRYFVESETFTLKTQWNTNTLYHVAEDAAQDYFDNHDGWESSWPLTFVILDEDFNELGQFVVDMEAVPSFFVTKKLVSETP